MKNASYNSTIFLFILFTLSVKVFSQASLRFSYHKFGNEKGDTIPYRLLFPDYDTLRRYPLVIFLHGSGERGKDNEAQLKWGVMNFATDQVMAMHPAFVIAPQCPLDDDWSNFDENEKSREIILRPQPTRSMMLVIGLIRHLVKTFAVDTNRIYITGLSSGGYGTFDAIQRFPHLFAAAVPICGGGDASKANLIAHIPIWIFHGSEDLGVNTMNSVDMEEALIKSGGHPGLTLYPGVGHFAWLAAYSDPIVINWIFRQYK